MKSEISAIEEEMGEMIILCDDIVSNSYLKTQDARKIIDLMVKGLRKIEELRISRDKAITRRDSAEAELKQIEKPKIEKPMKCKCGKMIRRPIGNKSGMCSACSSRENNRIRMKKYRMEKKK